MHGQNESRGTPIDGGITTVRIAAGDWNEAARFSQFLRVASGT
jgi:hypothetical protein